MKKNIIIATDAWHPQVNGVVRTLQNVSERLSQSGHHVTLITPNDFRSIAAPGYPEIRLSLFPKPKITHQIKTLKPTHIHIATEGPIGWATRHACRRLGCAFSTAYHTQFPEYLAAHYGIPASVSYRVVKQFHAAASSCMVATPSLAAQLKAKGFSNLSLWSRGVDLSHFSPHGPKAITLPGPVLIYVGRVSIEKNLSAFLDINFPGSKLVVGDGPALAALKERYPEVHFAGAQHGAQLAAYYRSGDIFVFPSKTDTYGLVLLEALASGLPVVAYPVMGPIDVLADCPAAVLTHDLTQGVRELQQKMQATNLAKPIADFIQAYSWEQCAQLFEALLVPCD